MNRRKFLTMLGLAPVAVAASKLPAEPTNRVTTRLNVDTKAAERNLASLRGGVVQFPNHIWIGEQGSEVVIPIPGGIYNQDAVIAAIKYHQRKGGQL